jgi:hypothetical protein
MLTPTEILTHYENLQGLPSNSLTMRGVDVIHRTTKQGVACYLEAAQAVINDLTKGSK